MIEVKIIKNYINWKNGDVVSVSEANAVKLIRNGIAVSLDEVKQVEEPKPKKSKK